MAEISLPDLFPFTLKFTGTIGNRRIPRVVSYSLFWERVVELQEEANDERHRIQASSNVPFGCMLFWDDRRLNSGDTD